MHEKDYERILEEHKVAFAVSAERVRLLGEQCEALNRRSHDCLERMEQAFIRGRELERIIDVQIGKAVQLYWQEVYKKKCR